MRRLAQLALGVWAGILGVTLGESAAPAPLPAGRTVRIGSAAPDFELPAAQGVAVRLSALRGHAVVLNFWASWCAACRVEMPWLADLHRRLAGRGLEVLGVSLDESGPAAAAAARSEGVGYPILLQGASIAGAYGGVRLLPQTFFIDRSGNVADVLTGATGRGDLEGRARRLLGRGIR